MSKESEYLEASRGKTMYDIDGRFSFYIASNEDLQAANSTFLEFKPSLVRDGYELIGSFICGDMVAKKEGRLVDIDHDSLEVNFSKMTEAEFYGLIEKADPRLEEKFYESRMPYSSPDSDVPSQPDDQPRGPEESRPMRPRSGIDSDGSNSAA